MPTKTYEGRNTTLWKTEVEVIDEYFGTPQFFADFAKAFYNIDTVEEFVQWIMDNIIRGTAGNFIEGAGPVDHARQEVTVLSASGHKVAIVKYEHTV
jgi:hypothetical protein